MKRESAVVWLHVSSFVVSSEQLEKRYRKQQGRKYRMKENMTKKIKNKESNTCPLLAGSTSSKFK